MISARLLPAESRGGAKPSSTGDKAENPVSAPTRQYTVFISYRHADNAQLGRQWASWLHQSLEAYQIPADLIGTRNARSEIILPSLYPVFRDAEELQAEAD